MADAPNTSSYILVSPDTVDLPNSRTLNPSSASGGIRIQDSGSALSIDTVGNLGVLNAYATNGLMAYNSAGSPVFSGKTITGSSSINVTNGNGVGGNPTLSVIDDTSIQQVNLQLNIPSNQQGTIIGTESMLNFIAGSGVNIGISPNGTYNRADITISANTGQSVSSIGNSGSDTSIVIAGTGSGPYTGAVTLAVPNWATVYATPNTDIQMQESTLQFCGSVGLTYNGSGGQVTLNSTTSPAAPALTVSTSVAPGTGLIFDSLFNFPGGNSGTVGQVLRLTSAPTGSTPGVLSWATIAGTGTVTSVGLTSSTSLLTVTGTSPITTSGSFALAITPGTNGQVLTTTGGAVAWGSASSGTVTGVTATAPVASSGGTAPVISITPGSNGQVLTTTGGAVVWGSGGGVGTVTNVSGTSGQISVATGTTTPVISLATTAVTAASYTNASLTVDTFGRLTAASSGTAPVTSISVTAPIASSGGTTPTLSLTTSGVTAGSYTLSSITVNAQGLITAASSGSGGSGVPFTTTGTGNLQIGNATALGSSVSGNVGAQQNAILSLASFAGMGGTSAGNGNYNTIMGTSSTGASLTTGAWNTIIGNETGTSLTTGNFNTLLGQGLLYGAGTGPALNNTFVGNSMAGNVSGGFSGSNNIGIGAGLYGAATTAARNILIGQTITGLTTGSNNILIGNTIAAPATLNNIGIIGSTPASSATFKLGIGNVVSATPLGTLHLGGAGGVSGVTGSTCIVFDPSVGANQALSPLAANAMVLGVNPSGVPYLFSKSTNASTNTQIPLLANLTGTPFSNIVTGQMLFGADVSNMGIGYFDALPAPASAGLVLKSTPATQSSTFKPIWGSASLAASEPPIFSGPAVQPPEATSVIAFADPGDVNDPTDFELPVDFTLGSSFRIVGLNRYGWILSTALGSGVTQKIVYNDQVVTGDNDTLAGIQCDPIYGTSPAAEYLSTSIELVYAKLQDDGTQVWVVYSSQGVIDLFQGA